MHDCCAFQFFKIEMDNHPNSFSLPSMSTASVQFHLAVGIHENEEKRRRKLNQTCVSRKMSLKCKYTGNR